MKITMIDAIDGIEKILEFQNVYSKKGVSLILNQVARDFDLYAANGLIDDFKLDVKLGIKKMRNSSKPKGAVRFG